ncbi:MAG: PH domain-containing protein [Flavobacteriales bacterium]
MPQRFRTKLGLELIIPITLIFGVTIFLTLRDGAWMAVAIQLLTYVGIGCMLYQTWYIIDGEELQIRVWFFRYPKIHIADIRSVKRTKIPISAPAASLDRLAIRYGKMGYQLISPQDKTAFVQALLKINPAIETDVVSHSFTQRTQ